MYEQLKQKFSETFARPAELIFSAPGRTELGGNHTDHQSGRVLAGAVSVDTVAAVSAGGDGPICVLSEGYPLFRMELSELDARPEERGSSAALVRGIAAGFARRGFPLRGFSACVRSDVLPGSGLSSSAAFEVLIGTIINHICACGLSPVEIAKLGRYAENVYFGKPCGLMDQTASAVGNIVYIDFADPDSPKVEPVDFDFNKCGHALCIINSGADHADLTAEYAAIPDELAKVSAVFGKERLRQVPEEDFFRRISEVRAAAGDRAALRAIHIFEDNRRVDAQVDALRSNDFARFLALVSESGRSSWMHLQNVVPTGAAAHQELAFTLALAERLLGGRGAFRVHGGGFAGTIQAFVPLDLLEAFRAETDRVLGGGSCQALSIRRAGGVLLEKL